MNWCHYDMSWFYFGCLMNTWYKYFHLAQVKRNFINYWYSGPLFFTIIRVFNLQIISVAADFVTELSMRIAMPARQLVGPFQFLDVVAQLDIYDNGLLLFRAREVYLQCVKWRLRWARMYVDQLNPMSVCLLFCLTNQEFCPSTSSLQHDWTINLQSI